MNVYVGIDWSANEAACSSGIGAGAPRRLAGAKRTLRDVEGLLDRVRKLAPENATVHVVIEAGAPGWVELFHHAGAVVHVADSKQAKAFAESLCSSGAKDDGRDSDNLVKMGQSPAHCPPAWEPRDDVRAQLEVLSSLHEAFSRDLCAAQQRLRSALREQMPALEAVMKDLTLGWVSKLLRAVPTARHASLLTENDVRAVLAGTGARETTRLAVLEALQATSAPWLSEGRARILALQVECLLTQVEQLGQQVSKIEAEMDTLTGQMELRKSLESVGGIGTKIANRLIRYAFEEEEPKHRDQASIQLGASPVFRGSAKDKKGRPKGHAAMRRAAPPRARATTYLLGRCAALELAWAGAMYADGRSRGQGPGTAYRRIARALLRILTALHRTGERYDDARYVAALKAKGVPWAAQLDAA